MNKTELIKAVAEHTGVEQKAVKRLVPIVFEMIADTIANGEKVNIPGFGCFESKDTSARKARNLQTGEEVAVPASKKPAFKAAKALKDKIKQQLTFR
ncbi:HU family DNA-binding protein [Paenibacillus sp. TH7-28]